MPLDVPRFRKSRAMAMLPPEHFMPWFGLILEAWHQLPAASIPNDDIELASLAGFGRQVLQWQAVRDGALYGWVLCSDGRFYHPVVAEKANEAWMRRLEDRHRKYVSREKKEDREPLPFDEWLEGASAPTHAHVTRKAGDVTKKTGDVTRKSGDFRPERRGEEKRGEEIPDSFEQWWEAVPRKVAKGQARKAYKTALKKTDAETLLAGIKRYAEAVRGKDAEYIRHATTWLNGEGWLDEPDPPPASKREWWQDSPLPAYAKEPTA